MDLRVSLLTVLFLAALSAPPSAAAAEKGCLSCHAPHLPDRGPCAGCHLGIDRTRRGDLAHLGVVPGRLLRYRIPGDPSVERGMRWVERAGCRRCHSIHGAGNRLAADLDRPSSRNPNATLEAILRPAAFMPDFRFRDREASELVNAILAGGRKIVDEPREGEVPAVVRFTDRDERTGNAFVKLCGGCHRMLSRRLGALGKGDAGPNLSGLPGRYYPRAAPDDGPWPGERLRKWLENPRGKRPGARMPPVRATREEFRGLAETLRGSIEQ